MSTLRTAAQQALEALETLVPTKGPSIYNRARDALKAALAEPVQEPVAWGVFEGENLHDFFTWREQAEEMAYYKGSHAVVMPLYTAPPQRKPKKNGDQQ